MGKNDTVEPDGTQPDARRPVCLRSIPAVCEGPAGAARGISQCPDLEVLEADVRARVMGLQSSSGRGAPRAQVVDDISHA